jgi:hypothetical protein
MSGAASLAEGWRLYAADNDDAVRADGVLSDEAIPETDEIVLLEHFNEVAPTVDSLAGSYLQYPALFDSVARARGASCTTEAARRYGLYEQIACCLESGVYIACYYCPLISGETQVLQCGSGGCASEKGQVYTGCVLECPDDGTLAPSAGSFRRAHMR